MDAVDTESEPLHVFKKRRLAQQLRLRVTNYRLRVHWHVEGTGVKKKNVTKITE